MITKETYRNHIKRIVFISLVIISFASCKKETATKPEITEYITSEKNGLLQKAETEQLKYTLIYKPKELLFPKTHFTEGFVSDSTYYFQLSISTINNEEVYALANNPFEIEEINQLLNFEFGSYLSLITANDTIAPSATQYNQSFGMSKTNDLLICFEVEKLLKQNSFVIEINKPMPVDNQKSIFSYKTKDIKRIPKLNKDEK